MRKVEIIVHNNQALELFTKRRGTIYEGFEVWMVGMIKGQRTVLSHFITNEHFERRLVYAQAGDLIWRDAQETEIPKGKTKIAEEEEKIIERGKFLDMERVGYYFNGISSIPIDRKAWNLAKSAIIGKWTDGVATIAFHPESNLTVVCPPAAAHPLYIAAHDNQADWWNFSSWMLFLMNDEKKRGERTGVWRCDENELHIFSHQRDRLVHVLKRVHT
jgi:hypothetical protein